MIRYIVILFFIFSSLKAEINSELFVPENVKDVIKLYEGWRSKAYKDAGGKHYAVGYGQSTTNPNKTITKKEGNIIFNKTIKNIEKKVKEFIKVPVNQNQFSVIVDLCYNVGSGKIRRSTLIKLLNKKEYYLAGLEIKRWVHANGKVLRGLVKRRNWNYELWTENLNENKCFNYYFAAGNIYSRWNSKPLFISELRRENKSSEGKRSFENYRYGQRNSLQTENINSRYRTDCLPSRYTYSNKTFCSNIRHDSKRRFDFSCLLFPRKSVLFKYRI